DKLLKDVTQLTGGSYLEEGSNLELGSAKSRRYVELWPYLVMALLGLFMLDIAVRRWEHVTGLWDMATGWLPGKA
ncbi:MAG TPA: hypothetical protein VK956_14765, partial [Verrucomicrobium sp.]|nr:hypothetical protein [Verrucomicrobium sp.]